MENKVGKKQVEMKQSNVLLEFPQLDKVIKFYSYNTQLSNSFVKREDETERFLNEKKYSGS